MCSCRRFRWDVAVIYGSRPTLICWALVYNHYLHIEDVRVSEVI